MVSAGFDEVVGFGVEPGHVQAQAITWSKSFRTWSSKGGHRLHPHAAALLALRLNAMAPGTPARWDHCR
jgi:hypothetical protein